MMTTDNTGSAISEPDRLMDSPDIRYANWLISKATENGECLDCHLSNASRGYCKVKGSGQAHRFIYATLIAPISPSLVVMHICDNRRCINPKHLKAATQHDNVLDMVAKGRNKPSTGAGIGTKRILTTEQHIELLALYNAGTTQRKLAAKYKVTQSTVWDYINNLEVVYV